MSGQYILDAEGNPVPCGDLHRWGKWMSVDANRRVGQDVVAGQRVSTVFLALDHSFGVGPPVLWETMIFDGIGAAKDYQERYTSLDAAKAGHATAVALAKQAHDDAIVAEGLGKLKEGT